MGPCLSLCRHYRYTVAFEGRDLIWPMFMQCVAEEIMRPQSALA